MTSFPQLDGFRGAPGLVRLIGHRGARGVMPENTLEGFRFMHDAGLDAVEFDVLLTRDGVPVVTHNHHLMNAATRGADGAWLTGAELAVGELTSAQLRQFDVGGLDGRSAYGQRFPDQVFLSDVTIPRLADLLDLALPPEGRALYFMLEMKSDPAAIGGMDAAAGLVGQVVADVRAKGLEHRTVLHSFDWALLAECGRVAPEMPRSFLSKVPQASDGPTVDDAPGLTPPWVGAEVSIPQLVADAGGQMWCPYFMDVTADLVAEAHDLDLLVSTWTVNEPDDIHRMIDAGVDGIVTDYPGRAQRILRDRNMVWR